MSSVNIILDNYNNTCYPGQTIAGRVECNFSSEKNLRAVRIKFRGRAKTEWTETERYYDHAHKKHRSRSIRYYAEEPYFDAEYNLIQGGENFQLPAGRHVYPFSYILPTRLPSSFEGSYGSIRYYIKATVDRPWKFDYEDKFALNVDSPLDLNYIPGLREPIATSVDKTMCSCWCNDSGALTFNMSLPASGFVPGQEVNIGAYVQNMTNVTAENVRFKIVGNLEFITRYPSTKTRYDEILIAACSEGGIGAHGEKSWTSSLTIPAEYVPNLMPCNIINISYTLHGKVVVPCPHTNLENDVRVMIGTVPLTGVSTTFPGGPPPEIPFPLPSGPTTEGTPLLPPLPAPYPGGDVAYPPGGIAPYPPGGSASYPPGGVAPYPPGGNAPYPPSGGTPYPPSGDTKYPPPAAPYSPGGVSNGFGDTKNPSAPPAGAPYPAGGTPYPPAGAPSASAPAPSAPDVLGGAPYPPSSAPAADSSFSLPSYEEAENLKEKSEKPEKEKN